MFRYNIIGDLFYDSNINNSIEVNTDERCTSLKYAVREDGTPENKFHYCLESLKEKERPTSILHNGAVSENGFLGNTTVHFYEYKKILNFSSGYLPHLSVPYGENLPSLLLANSDFKNWVSEFLKVKGLMLHFKPSENEIIVSKIVNDVIYSYPYFAISETLQRFIFYNIVLKSNKSSVLLFD